MNYLAVSTVCYKSTVCKKVLYVEHSLKKTLWAEVYLQLCKA